MPRSRASLLDDGFCSHLFEGTSLIDPYGIPMLMDNVNRSLPIDMVPLDKVRQFLRTGKTHKHVCGFVKDRRMLTVFTKTQEWIPSFRMFDGVIIPDLSIIDGRPACVQVTSIALCRALGFYLQRRNIPIIPTVRWGDESTYPYFHLGIPKGSVVAIGTLTCLKNDYERRILSEGLPVMLRAIEPSAILVYGRMPDEIFGPYKEAARFKVYASRIDRAHGKGCAA